MLADILLSKTVTEPARNKVILDIVSVSSRDFAGKVTAVRNLVLEYRIFSTQSACILNDKETQKWGLGFQKGKLCKSSVLFLKAKAEGLICEEDILNAKEKDEVILDVQPQSDKS